MNVELKGVMQDASVMHISDDVHLRSRMLHCGAVSLTIMGCMPIYVIYASVARVSVRQSYAC